MHFFLVGMNLIGHVGAMTHFDWRKSSVVGDHEVK